MWCYKWIKHVFFHFSDEDYRSNKTEYDLIKLHFSGLHSVSFVIIFLTIIIHFSLIQFSIPKRLFFFPMSMQLPNPYLLACSFTYPFSNQGAKKSLLWHFLALFYISLYQIWKYQTIFHRKKELVANWPKTVVKIPF